MQSKIHKKITDIYLFIYLDFSFFEKYCTFEL